MFTAAAEFLNPGPDPWNCSGKENTTNKFCWHFVQISFIPSQSYLDTKTGIFPLGLHQRHQKGFKVLHKVWPPGHDSQTRNAQKRSVLGSRHVMIQREVAMSRMVIQLIPNKLIEQPFHTIFKCMFDGSLEVKLPTKWTDEKQRWKESEKRREEKRREETRRDEKRREGKRRDETRREETRREEEIRSQKRKSEKKEDPGARKGRKVSKHCIFPMICRSGGSKSRLAKAAGAEPAGQMRDEKLHSVVARSTFASEKAKGTSCSEHFLKLRCRKSAHRCGAKHISKSKCTKHTRSGLRGR